MTIMDNAEIWILRLKDWWGLQFVFQKSYQIYELSIGFFFAFLDEFEIWTFYLRNSYSVAKEYQLW
jgi:hypothetical protein